MLLADAVIVYFWFKQLKCHRSGILIFRAVPSLTIKASTNTVRTWEGHAWQMLKTCCEKGTSHPLDLGIKLDTKRLLGVQRHRSFKVLYLSMTL